MLGTSEVRALLRGLGIEKNETVLMHTSMRAIGEVEGGCDGLIDAFTSYLSDGLFVIPTHTWGIVGKVTPIYDVRTTVPCIGALPTVAATRADGVRSLHPTHSVTAFGKDAEAFVQGEEKATSPCPPDGCWARLYDRDAKILLVGVEQNRNTYIHAVDEMLDLPGRLREPIPLTIIDREGREYKILFQKHGNTGSEHFTNYQKPLDACGALTYGTLGGAKVICCDVRRLTEVIKHLWSRADYDLCAEEREIPEALYADLL